MADEKMYREQAMNTFCLVIQNQPGLLGKAEGNTSLLTHSGLGAIAAKNLVDLYKGLVEIHRHIDEGDKA